MDDIYFWKMRRRRQILCCKQLISRNEILCYNKIPKSRARAHGFAPQGGTLNTTSTAATLTKSLLESSKDLVRHIKENPYERRLTSKQL